MIEKIIKDVWFGREKLWKVFWFYKILGGTLAGILVEISARSENNSLLATSFAFYVVFGIWTLKGLFACRFNSTNQTYLPKLIEIFVFINIFFLLTSIILLLNKFLNVASV